MNQPSPKNQPPRKRPMPIRRFEEAADDLAAEERNGRGRGSLQPTSPEEEADLPRYLRRDRESGSGNLVRIALFATLGLMFLVFVSAYFVGGEPAPKIPANVKVDRGLAVLARPRGLRAELKSGSRTVASLVDDDRDGFIWFQNAAPGAYTLSLSAEGYQKRDLAGVQVPSSGGKTVEFSTDTDLKKKENS